MNPPDLAQLIALARAGDREALDRTFSALTPKLVRMVDLRLDAAHRRRFEPMDVVQDALIDATRRFPEWCAQDRYPFYVWLRLLTAQALATALRRHVHTQKRGGAVEQSLDASRSNVSAASAADWLMSSQTGPSEAVRRNEVRERVLAALEGLDPLDREILVLRNFEQLTNEEAAAELGIEPAAASKRFTRALQRMRPALRTFENELGSARP